MEEIECWKNGEWVSASKLSIETWDAHYFFGWAVFDAFRTYKHKLFQIQEHLDRLYKGAKLASVPIKYTKEELLDIINQVMERNKRFFIDDEYRFMVFATPGNFKIFDDYGKPEPKLSIQLTTTSRYAKFIYPYLEKGYTSLITHQKQIPSRFFDVRIKSCSRLHYGMADAECKEYGSGVYPILLDEFDNICESSGSNIAFMKDEEVFIPKGTDMLNGCTLKSLKKSLKYMDIPFQEGIYKPYDIIDCDGILYTSTYSGITPSYKLIYKEQEYELNKTGLYEEILKGFSHIVGLDVKKQWKRWYDEK